MDAIECRPATEADYPAICALVRSEAELFLVWPSGRYPLSVAQLQRLAETREALTVMVIGDQVVGFANYYDYEAGEKAFIGNVVIAAHRRGQGLGRMLVEHMLAQGFGEHALRELRISVFNQNTPALLLYSRLGFMPYGIEERKDSAGKNVALIHMKLAKSEISSASLSASRAAEYQH